MKTAIIYNTSTGLIIKTIRSVVRADQSDDISLNVGSGQLSMEVAADHEALQAPGHYRIDGGVLNEKIEVTVSGDTAFTANGTDEGQVDFTGLTADAQVKINTSMVTVTQADPHLILTSDVPKIFEIEIRDPLHWSAIYKISAE